MPEYCDFTDLPVESCACKKHRPDLVEEKPPTGPTTIEKFLEWL